MSPSPLTARAGAEQRLMRAGELKLLILQLIDEQPRHGYDIIRTLESQMCGVYRPSPGSVYPLLRVLDQQGYVTTRVEVGTRGRRRKKVYALTDLGKRLRGETCPHKPASASGLGAVMQAMRELAVLLMEHARRGNHDEHRLRHLAAIVQRARAEVERLDALQEHEESLDA